jgi:2',3'-cyclic-nucleotide 2'-phosphodiesterase (5'-nucleotidase family)
MLKIIKKFHLLLLLIVLSSNIYAKTEFVIFHLNDTHGRVSENDKSIGFSKIATYINDARKKNKHVLFFDAGDTLHGTIIANLSKGSVVVDIYNAMKLDAMAAGNHDFNFGLNRLLELSKEAKFDILASNVVYIKDNSNALKQNKIIKINKEVTVGVFGLSTPETAYKTHPKNVEDIKFLDIATVAKQQVDMLKKQGANFIIAVGHLGIDDSTLEYEQSVALAKVAGIDLVIDGHSHSKLPNGLLVNNVLFAQTGEYDQNLGMISVVVDKDKKAIKAELVAKESFEKVAKNSAIEDIITKYTKNQSTNLDVIVANTDTVLEGNREFVRAQITNLGFIIANSLQMDLGADVAFVNGGSIRAPINKGDIRVRDIITALPFGNSGVLIEVTGEVLLQALEHSVKFAPEPAGSFLQVSGVSFDINLKNKAGSRVSNVKINNKKLDLKATYKLATLDFIIAGGDGYDMLKGKKALASSDAIDQIFTRYLANAKNITSKTKLPDIKIKK